MNPFPWINSWFDQNEGLVDKAIELFQRAIFLLEKDIPLQLWAEYDFVATHKAEVR